MPSIVIEGAKASLNTIALAMAKRRMQAASRFPEDVLRCSVAGASVSFPRILFNLPNR
jgi:hypothetical protein